MKKGATMLKVYCAGLAVAAGAMFVACGDADTTEQITNNYTTGLDMVSSVADLPKCTKDNEGEQIIVKEDGAIRYCSDGKWYAVAGDSESSDGEPLVCTTKALKDSSGIKIICNGDSIGVVLNGVDGKDGEKGETGAAGKDGAAGEAGEKGADGNGCTIDKNGSKLAITCGDKSVTLELGEDGSPIGGAEVVLDSEQVAVSLDSVKGASQKGPFLSGSKVLVKELRDGRSLTQTGNNFDGKILNDKGEFRITARMLVSQYVMLEANGYYRNEVTGENSSSPLTLFGITDVTGRDIVNINLLTHLEYERVYYLVTKEGLTVNKAKKQAQKEILDILHIDNSGFSNSEDLSIAGTSDEDGALLAFSILFQGDRSVSELTELLTKISTDMEKDGEWSDFSTKKDIAIWAMVADTSGRLNTIRKNVAQWGLGAMVPKFEPYVRNFWRAELGLGRCGDSVKIGVVTKSSNDKIPSDVRFICDEINDETYWRVATDIEKDTYQWSAGEDGQVKLGDVTGKKYYLYDAVKEIWREASNQEQLLGGCTEKIASDASSNTGKVNGLWYMCENRSWIQTSAYFVDTQTWVEGSDGSLKKGDSTDLWYVWDETENTWRDASFEDYTLGFNGCTTKRAGSMGQAMQYDGNFYQCDIDHKWVVLTDKVAYNTVGLECKNDGKMLLGLVDTKTYFVCSSGVWREATIGEEQAGIACFESNEGFSPSKEYYCENGVFRLASFYDFEYGIYFNPEIDYGELVDERDGSVYKTVKIGTQEWMAENMRFADSARYSYLKGHTWCYNDKEKNCQVGGRYYTWTAAMNIDGKWDKAFVPKGTITAVHQGICPNGWHVPSKVEWETLLEYVGDDVTSFQSVGINAWTSATNSSGFGALPMGHRIEDYYGVFHDVDKEARFWSTTEDSFGEAFYFNVRESDVYITDFCSTYDETKQCAISVRCVRDTPATEDD